ncbi:MAG: C45 family peptidase, partial [Planctomycetota bacterium]
VNQERLWLNMNGFFAKDQPQHHLPVIPYPLVIREALETCRSIGEVEDLLRASSRDEGMAIYAVDGKTGEATVIECGFGTFLRRDPVGSKTVVSCSRDLSIREEARLPSAPIFGSNTRERIARLRELLAVPMTDPPSDLIRVMAASGVEAPDTLYSNVACPETGEVWFGSGGPPAASAGRWCRVGWPWD